MDRRCCVMFRWDVRVSRNYRYAAVRVLITSASVVMRSVRAKFFLFFCRIFCTGGRWDDFVCWYLLSITFVPNESSGLVRVL